MKASDPHKNDFIDVKSYINNGLRCYGVIVDADGMPISKLKRIQIVNNAPIIFNARNVVEFEPMLVIENVLIGSIFFNLYLVEDET